MMKKLMVIIVCLIGLVGCERYRVVEMENGLYKVQARFRNLYNWEWVTYYEYNTAGSGYTRYRNIKTKEEACRIVEELKVKDEEYRKANTIKRIVDCEEK